VQWAVESNLTVIGKGACPNLSHKDGFWAAPQATDLQKMTRIRRRRICKILGERDGGVEPRKGNWFLGLQVLWFSGGWAIGF
jgi:hypothetical protein